MNHNKESQTNKSDGNQTSDVANGKKDTKVRKRRNTFKIRQLKYDKNVPLPGKIVNKLDSLTSSDDITTQHVVLLDNSDSSDQSDEN